MNDILAREIWQVIEPLHAVTYFAPTCIADRTALGLRGYWMGYFASRAAPLGTAGPELVRATFYNFHSRMVRRAIPDAWTFTTPAAVLADRARSAGEVLRRLVPDVATAAERALPALRAAMADAPVEGRPLFAANRALPDPTDPVEALWQATTALREHRGDGHVACLLSEGIDGCEAHVLLSADLGIGAQQWRDNRGWDDTDWDLARARLETRGLLSGTALTEAGRTLRTHIETRTDTLARTAYPDTDAATGIIDILLPTAHAVVAGGVVVSPSPLGADPDRVSTQR